MTEAIESLTENCILIPADIQPRTRMVFGSGSISNLGQIAKELGGQRVMVVSDPGVVRAGHTTRGIQSLEDAGLTVTLFDGARENPTTVHVQSGVDVANDFQPDLLIGLGGGSSMDCAKGINFLYTNKGQMSDYWGVDKATQPMLPLICVPTTSGTGSEMQSFALISDAQTHVKMACGDKKTAARVAILDPELTLTQPAQVSALTGIDAISHAVETFVSKRRTAISQMYSREAFRLLSSSVLQVLESPANLTARSAMHLGASFAGLAIEYSMLGAAHALANPLTARFGTAHGQAVGLMLPHVVRLNAVQCENDYCELMKSFAGQNFSGQTNVAGETTDEIIDQDLPASEQLAQWITTVVRKAGLATTLSELNIDAGDSVAAELGTEAAKQWTGTFNPRPVDANLLTEVYRSAV